MSCKAPDWMAACRLGWSLSSQLKSPQMSAGAPLRSCSSCQTASHSLAVDCLQSSLTWPLGQP
eukprot:14929508-Alexandrium_andersonii.AAC.1